jgi:hypothetical protein
MPNTILLAFNPFTVILTSFITFLKKVNKMRHPSRNATEVFCTSAKLPAFKVVRDDRKKIITLLDFASHGNFYMRQPFVFSFFWFVSFSLSHQQRKKMNRTNLLLDGGIK